MGNPDSPTPPHIVDKLVEAVQDPRTHRYSRRSGIPGLRRALAAYYQRRFGVDARPGDRGRRHPRLEGRPGQPRPGDHQPGRHHPGAEPVLSDPPVRLHHRRRGGAQRCRPTPGRRHAARRWTARCGTRVPKPTALMRELPVEPDRRSWPTSISTGEIVAFARRHEIWVLSDLAYAEIYFERQPPPSILQVAGRARTSRSSSPVAVARPIRCPAGAWASPPATRG